MTIALTAYFYFIAVAAVLTWAASLFLPHRPKTPTKSSAAERWAGGLGMILLIALVTAPWAYLQWVGLEALGFPGWIAWVIFAASIVGYISNLARNVSPSGHVSALPLLGLLLAWHGLQSLS